MDRRNFLRGGVALATGTALASCGGGGGGGGGVDTGDQFLGFDRGAVGCDDFHQHTSGGCRDFQHHFVGFNVDQDFVSSDGFADFFLPLQQGGFRHRF